MTEFPALIVGSGPLVDYMAANKGAVTRTLSDEGAVLFRGFDVPDAYAFDATVEAFGKPGFTYEDSLSNAVRTNVTDRVFTANEAPPETEIFLHHEMAQTPIYPSALFFYCEVSAKRGGETPLCRSDWVWQRLKDTAPAFADRLGKVGVRYTNVMPSDHDSGSGQGRSWHSTLSAGTREAAEARLSQLGYSWVWQDDGSLRATTPTLPAIREVGAGRHSFFNQLIAAFRGWSDSRNEPGKAITFGDGAPITAADISPAIAIADELTYDLQWQPQDVALVDNFSVMHGRRPFQGKRRILASLIS